jgi:hydroxypyruvate isomerase
MLRFAANLSLMFGEVPLPERFGAARAAGFGAVEIQFPYAETATTLAVSARAAAVDVVLINAPVAADAPFGLACQDHRRAEFRDGLARAAEYACALGVPRINVLAGQSQGRALDDCRRRLVVALLEAADRLERLGIEVLLEMLNPGEAPDYVVPDLEAAETVLDACDGRVGLQFDIYHVARIGLDPFSALQRSLGRVRHVQFADAPGRHEPGTGTLTFEPIWERLRAAGYTGWISAEYRPSRATVETLAWLHEWRCFTAPR